MPEWSDDSIFPLREDRDPWAHIESSPLSDNIFLNNIFF